MPFAQAPVARILTTLPLLTCRKGYNICHEKQWPEFPGRMRK
jgi:hypothetical protein